MQIEFKIVNSPIDLKKCNQAILPGVGSFKVASDEIRKNGFDKAIISFCEDGKNMLGICMGMQLLFSKGYEGGESKGLNLIEGEVVKLSSEKGNSLMHIGWNNFENNNIKITENIDETENFYFVHGYHVVPSEPIKSIKTIFNNNEIVSVVCKNNIIGMQFHPEKSHLAGKKILTNFLKL